MIPSSTGGPRPPRLIDGVLALGLALAVTMPVLWSLLERFELPARPNTAGVVSGATRAGLNPYSNHLKYFLLLAVPTLVAGILLARDWIPKPPRRLISHRLVRIVLILTLGLAWIVNLTYRDLARPIVDTFHEGEYLGFLPVFLQSPRPFAESFLTQGFGVNALPALAGHWLGGGDNGIAWTRLIRSWQAAVSWIGCFWILWEVSLAAAVAGGAGRLFLVLAAVFCGLGGRFYLADGWFGNALIPPSSSLLFLQVALVLRLFRRGGAREAVLLGILLPPAFLYSYDRAVYALALYGLAAGLTFGFGRRLAAVRLAGGLGGAAISCLVMLMLLGREQLAAIAAQLGYWARHGEAVWFLPLMTGQGADSAYFFACLLPQAAAILHLAAAWRRTAPSPSPQPPRGDPQLFLYHSIRVAARRAVFLRSHSPEILLLILSLLFLLSPLRRSDLIHFGNAAVPAVLLLCALLARYAAPYAAPAGLTAAALPWALAAALGLGLIWSNKIVWLNPVVAAERILDQYRKISTPDSRLLRPDYLEATQVMRPLLERSPCFFTLTSELTWYYLLRRPSCSPFHQLVFARSTEAQQQLVGAIRNRRPPVVLLTNDAWSNSIDDIPVAQSNPIVYQFFLEAYRPFLQIGKHWFWQPAERPPEFTAGPHPEEGSVDPVAGGALAPDSILAVSGWARAAHPDGSSGIYLSRGPDNRLILAAPMGTASGDRARFELAVPPGLLTPGPDTLRVWKYDPAGQRLIQLGADLSVHRQHSPLLYLDDNVPFWPR